MWLSSDEKRFGPCPVLLIPGNGSGVDGITSLGEELFVVRLNATQIDVYDINNVALRRRLTVPGPAAQSDLAACPINNCIYMSVYSRNVVYRVDVSGNSSATTWYLSNYPYGLAVTRNGTVLVVLNLASTISEYTTNGILIREISLLPAIDHPLCVAQLPGGQLGVTNQGAQNRYCVITSDGHVVKCYGGSPGSGDGQFSSPRGIAYDTLGRTYVTDYGNSRIVVLELDTLSASYLTINAGVNPLTGPFHLHVDKTFGRLYIGEWSGALRLFILSK